MTAGQMLCQGCGDPLTTNHQRATELCDWCYAEQVSSYFDERDEADDRYQQVKDLVGRD